jgi:hypothetical protein
MKFEKRETGDQERGTIRGDGGKPVHKQWLDREENGLERGECFSQSNLDARSKIIIPDVHWPTKAHGKVADLGEKKCPEMGCSTRIYGFADKMAGWEEKWLSGRHETSDIGMNRARAGEAILGCDDGTVVRPQWNRST